jgi:mannose-6-phosphate isomerase-like protein (cupin superfamily)
MAAPFRPGTSGATTTKAAPAATLEGALAGTPQGADLAALLDALPEMPVRTWPAALPAPDLAALAPHLRFEGGCYTRTLLAATPRAEMLLMGWLPGHASRIHDHGVSHGLSWALAGAGVEETFRLEEGRPLRAATRAFRQGDVLYELPGDVHRLRNPGPNLLVTLHVYAPRLQEFRTYDEP